MDLVAEELFDKIRSRFPSLVLGDKDGKVTTRPQDAYFFEFKYRENGHDFGDVVISLYDTGYLKLYFNKDMISEAGDKDGWYSFLKDMSKFAHRNLLNYEALNIDRKRLDKRDFDFIRNRNKTEEELTMESKLYGSKQKSYQDLNGAKLIVQHHKTVDEEKHGARSRNIRAIYIENDHGERFRFPNNYLPAARAMARHVANEGYPNDERGAHILEIMKEMSDLRGFVRAVRKDDYVNEDAQEVIDRATDRYYGLKNTLVSMTKQRGYADYFENWQADEIEVDENDITDLKAKLTRSVFDDRLEDSLKAVGKAMKISEKKEGAVFDYGNWMRMAKSAGAEVQGDVKSSVAIKNGKEIGSWSQDEEDLEAKYGSDVKQPGYGEINIGTGDRAEGGEREYNVPTSLDMAPGENVLKAMQFAKADKIGPLVAVLRDIAGRAKDDETSVFAADMAQKVSSIGTTFGKRMDDPGFKDQYMKAIELAKLYLAAVKGNKESKEQTQERVATDPFSSYEKKMDSIEEGFVDSQEAAEQVIASIGGEENLTMDDVYKAVEEYVQMGDGDDMHKANVEEIAEIVIDQLGITEAAKPDYLDLDKDGNKKEPMKQAAKDAKKKKTEETAVTEAYDMVCKDCGCHMHKPDPNCDCPHDCNDEQGAHWVMAEGKMSDIDLHVREMIADGASDEEIIAMHPGVVSKEDLKRYRSVESDSTCEYDESLVWLKKAAGIWSSARSNFGVREGEQGYQKSLRDEIGKYLEGLK